MVEGPRGVVARGRFPKNFTTPEPGGPYPTTPTPGGDGPLSTEDGLWERYTGTLFSLIQAATHEPTTPMDAGAGVSSSPPAQGTAQSVLNSTLAELTSLASEALTTMGGGGGGGGGGVVNATGSTQGAWSSTPGTGSLGYGTDSTTGYFNTSMPILTTTGDGGLSASSLEAARAEFLRVALWQWMSPFIFLLGFFGNIAILIVLANRPVMSDNTTSVYVRCLAIADLLTLITGIIPEWMAFTDIFNFEEVHPVSCKFYKFFAYTSSDASIWILTAFSVERFIAVVFPFKRQKGWCKVSQVKIICVALVLVGVAKNLQSFWTRGSEFRPVEEGEETAGNETMILHSNCGYPTPADVYFNLYVRPWIVLVSINIIPMVILWFCNFSVIWTISRRRTIQRLQLQMSSASKRASALTQQVTIMCLCASFSFIVFMTPSFILFCGKAYWAYDPVSRGPYLVAKAVNNQLMYINNSINFYLYLFSGERFRQSVISIFIKCQWNRSRDMRATSMRPPSSVASTRVSRSRKDPYEVAVVTNNGVRLKATPDVSSVSGTPHGSRDSLQNSKY